MSLADLPAEAGLLREAESNGRLKVMSLARCLFSIPLYFIADAYSLPAQAGLSRYKSQKRLNKDILRHSYFTLISLKSNLYISVVVKNLLV